MLYFKLNEWFEEEKILGNVVSSPSPSHNEPQQATAEPSNYTYHPPSQRRPSILKVSSKPIISSPLRHVKFAEGEFKC